MALHCAQLPENSTWQYNQVKVQSPYFRPHSLSSGNRYSHTNNPLFYCELKNERKRKTINFATHRAPAAAANPGSDTEVQRLPKWHV